MKDEKLKKITKLPLDDRNVLETLSDIGVYVTNYETGESLSSDKWRHFFDLVNNNNFENKNDFINYIHPDDRESVGAVFNEILKGEEDSYEMIYRQIQPDGSYKWIKAFSKIAKMGDNGSPALVIGYDSDITELKDTQNKLEKRNRELEQLHDILKVVGSSLDIEKTVNNIFDGLAQFVPYETCSLQLLKGDKLHVIGARGFKDNHEVCEMTFPYPETGSLSTTIIQNGKPFMTNNLAVDFPNFVQIDNYLPIISWIGIPLITSSGIVGILALDGYRINTFDEHHLELCSIIGDHFAIAMENAMLHENAFNMAMMDSLTGTGSRHRIKIEGRLMFESAIRYKSNISVALLDLDHFKEINDSNGHDAGDIILKEFANLCSKQLRSIDILGRYGGDEFIIIMPETDESQGKVALNRIKEKCKFVKFSCGIVSGIPDKDNLVLNKFITLADNELYKVKNSGKDGISSTTIV